MAGETESTRGCGTQGHTREDDVSSRSDHRDAHRGMERIGQVVLPKIVLLRILAGPSFDRGSPEDPVTTKEPFSSLHRY